jgi:hypothetical protein
MFTQPLENLLDDLIVVVPGEMATMIQEGTMADSCLHFSSRTCRFRIYSNPSVCQLLGRSLLTVIMWILV